MQNKNTTYPSLLLVLLLLLMGGSPACRLQAQNNPYKIDDRLYPIFMRADRQSKTPQGLDTADSLRLEARRLDDKKAECLAYTIPVKYYMEKSDYPQLEKAVKALMEISRANDYLQYYYYAYNQHITYLLNNHRPLRALQMTEEMKQQAEKDRYPYGMYTCIRTISRIYSTRGQEALANQYNLEALEYMLKELPDQDPAQLYAEIAQYYSLQGKDLKTAMEYCEKAEQNAKTERSALLPLIQKCIILYRTKRYSEFKRLFLQLEKKTAQYKSIHNSINMTKLRIAKNIVDRNYTRAHQYADSLQDLNAKWAHAQIYEASGMYQQCIAYLRMWHDGKDSLATKLQMSDIAELNVQIGNQQLKMQNMQLELKQQQSASRYRLIIFSVIIICLALSLVYLISYLRRRNKTNNELRAKNEELRIARERAEVANRMKTAFIQNMSHEIRTPLNSIVGFSQIITDPDMETPPEEAREYSRLIQHNSELLTTLVNDVLTLSDLESSQYSVSLSPYPCNELCSEAIANVAHRKPANVHLYYTSDAPDDYMFLTDSKRASQVLTNFLTNSEKYTTEGEIHLHCSLSENPGYITFSVTDTGCGIPADRRDTVFERFEKLNPFEQGTGLGLNICRIIAGRLGGKVQLDTEYSNGSRFLFILPLEREEQL